MPLIVRLGAMMDVSHRRIRSKVSRIYISWLAAPVTHHMEQLPQPLERMDTFIPADQPMEKS